MAQTPLQFPLLFHTCCQRVTVWLLQMTVSLVRERLNIWVAMVFMLLCRSAMRDRLLNPYTRHVQEADRVTLTAECACPSKL